MEQKNLKSVFKDKAVGHEKLESIKVFTTNVTWLVTSERTPRCNPNSTWTSKSSHRVQRQQMNAWYVSPNTLKETFLLVHYCLLGGKAPCLLPLR